MSEAVRDLLTHGVAAARGNSKDEARHYLEWVLSRSDAEIDQQVEAWLHLSELTDDPRQKRDYLENVVAVLPGNVQARRGLAIIDGRLEPEEILDPLRPALALGATPAAAGVRRYTCPRCGGKTSFDAVQGALACPYCGAHLAGHHTAVPTAAVSEADFLATLPTAAAHRWELPSARALACSGCGATVTLAPGQASVECLFCGSAHVAVVAARRDLIQPWGLVPFALDQQAALQRIRAWIQGQPFLPANLESDAWLEQPRPVYLPFWTFDVLVQLNWTGAEERAGSPGMNGAMLGLGPRAGKQAGGGQRREPTGGIHVEMFDDIFVPAGRHLPAGMLDRLADFDARTLVPYSPDLVASWPVEIYHVSLADASMQAHAHARAIAEERARGDVELQQVQGLSFRRGGVTIESFKLILLPVWIGALELSGRRYPVALNGSTGIAAGHLPRSGLGGLISRIWS